MSRCLWCGAELPTGSRGHFCKSSGHHILFKNKLLRELADGTITQEGREWLEFFHWMPTEVSAPVVETPVVNEISNDLSINRKFGVELECFIPDNDSDIISEVRSHGVEMTHTGYNHDTVSYWKSLYDSSIRPDYGFIQKEYVSPPLEGDKGLKDLCVVCDVIKKNNGRTNYSTGTHIHLDASDLAPQDLAKIIYFYGKFESQFDALFGDTRKASRNRFCKSVRRFVNYCKYSGFEYFSNIGRLERVMKTRYVKVNVYSYLKHGTIEFRQHDGTLDGQDLTMWIKLCTRVVDFVKNGGDVINVRGSIFNILGCTKKEKDYWKGVKAANRAA